MAYVQLRAAPRRGIPVARPVYPSSAYAPAPLSGASTGFVPARANPAYGRRSYMAARRAAAAQRLATLAQDLARLGVYPDYGNGLFFSPRNHHNTLIHPFKAHKEKKLEEIWNNEQGILHPEALPGIGRALGQPAVMQSGMMQPTMVQQQVPVAMPMMPVAINHYGY